ncbi:hypothetical protein CNMCM5793_006964 [Aspergillus hiratsukae]|uniref:Uncharacterized protein n=1 Tax=Aspergillus hiratsukae TaxID=1194566 RepID=A0A8H6PIC0_9EURO|nr:hypothetical protein CNMCM5793_006964 [Aspergillus hiratsukae]KAF7165851.1 hypothetical protein CNMCM6106_001896 [Aspergillus hiratsukae]
MNDSRCSRTQEASHEVIGRHGGSRGGVVQIDDEDVHDVVSGGDAERDEEHEGERDVQRWVMFDQCALANTTTTATTTPGKLKRVASVAYRHRNPDLQPCPLDGKLAVVLFLVFGDGVPGFAPQAEVVPVDD